MADIETDVVVLGLGVHGTAATASLARRGHRVRPGKVWRGPRSGIITWQHTDYSSHIPAPDVE